MNVNACMKAKINEKQKLISHFCMSSKVKKNISYRPTAELIVHFRPRNKILILKNYWRSGELFDHNPGLPDNSS